MSDDRACYQNRELSWLKFNERVLEEAEDGRNPLCERLSFLSIFQSNLDEFFMVRIGSLHDMMLLKKEERENKTNMTAKEQIAALLKRIQELTARKDQIYRELMGQISEQGVELICFSELTEDESKYLERYFVSEIQPLLSTIIVGKKQPFPFLKNKEIYAVVVLGGKKGDKLGIIPCSNEVFKRLIPVPSGKNHYMLVEELILHYIPEVFDHYEVKSKSLIRIIRNADIDVDEAFDDEELDYRDCMKKLISTRKKLCPVKLEHSRVLDDTVIEHLRRDLGLFKDQVFHMETPLELSFLFQIQNALREKKELFYEKRIPQNSPEFVDNEPVLDQICEHDKLLFYPYESMKPFIRLLKEAGNDTRVVSIKMTLYRVARNSQIVEALIDAAENGKEVVVLVELRARFDEQNNIDYSEVLEDAGCQVIYGLPEMKVHSKLCLITRKRGESVQYFTQVGTGNYNEVTSEQYTDLSVITSDERVGRDAAQTFEALATGQTPPETEALWVAPLSYRSRVLELIETETAKGEAGRIAIKVNSMNDIGVMTALIHASRAGVRTELFIRGICCLRPGVAGYTENITVRSVVGRYLEHSRIFAFGEGAEQRIFIGSGDLLNRNTRRRVEAFIECVTPETREGVLAILDALRADREKSWMMQPDGSYSRAETVPGTASHDTLYEYFGEKTVEPLPPEKKHGWLWRLFHPNKKKLHGNEA